MVGRASGAVALVVVAAALAGAAAPRASAPSAPPDPGPFVERLVVQMVRDDYAHAWLTLHPAHKAVAARWEYLFCELKSPIPGDIQSLDIVEVADEPFFVAGVGRVWGKSVTFRVVLRGLGPITHTSHVVAVHGSWRWILTAGRYRLYRTDGCGGNGLTA